MTLLTWAAPVPVFLISGGSPIHFDSGVILSKIVQFRPSHGAQVMTSYFNDCDITIANSNDKHFSGFFLRAHAPPHFEKGSATHGQWAPFI